MRNMAIGIFVSFLIIALLQPLIEASNLMKDKVVLGSAILNSCRAARNNALSTVDYYVYDGEELIIGNLSAFLEEKEFCAFFAEAFCETLGVDLIGPSENPMIFDGNGLWNKITVDIELEFDKGAYPDTEQFENRGVGKVIVNVETPYLFRTSLLKTFVEITGGEYTIKETRVFLVQIIN